MSRQLEPSAKPAGLRPAQYASRMALAGRLALVGALCAAPILALEGVRWASAAPFSWSGFAVHVVLVGGLVVLTRWTRPSAAPGRRLIWAWPALATLGLTAAAGGAYALTQATWAAWAVTAGLWAVLLGLAGGWSSKQQAPSSEALSPQRHHPSPSGLGAGDGTAPRRSMRIVHYALGASFCAFLALLAGLVPVALSEVESHFADEEFFVALQAAALSGVFVLLVVASRAVEWWVRAWPRSLTLPSPQGEGMHVRRGWVAGLVALLALGGGVAIVRAYQHSFYPPQAPAYSGVTPQSPYLCGTAPMADQQPVNGAQVFERLLARVAANPHKGPPEYGMLALGTGQAQRADAFRAALLAEAAQGQFTGPANSVKWTQYEAALRAYYLPRVRAAFPSLFSADDWAALQSWFAAINRRALTVEPVDWLYGLALAREPQGPYENQENGAGLLALLEAGRLAAPELESRNLAYLEGTQRGWDARFRNTDDVFPYQIEWIDNAYFQWLSGGQSQERNLQLSFAWLLDQALPDGTPLSYNYPAEPSLAGVAYLAARLTQDPSYLWLADRALDQAEQQGKTLTAQPGAEESVGLVAQAPAVGSCLLYGDSGLPNQVGPLAPDKIVFRDGWALDSSYLLLNLRFTGWHRYKATNTVTSVYQGEPLVSDDLQGEAFGWLPVGRSLFRDKRVPRENLSGLLVERTGMSRVLFDLTGIGGPWAQDPPYYAEVVDFRTGEELDWSHTRLAGWRGWQQDRWVYLYHGSGPIVVVDEAAGPARSKGAVVWQQAASGQRQAAENILVVPLEQGDVTIQCEASRIMARTVNGRLRVATVFLTKGWTEARVWYDAQAGALHVSNGEQQIMLPLPNVGAQDAASLRAEG